MLCSLCYIEHNFIKEVRRQQQNPSKREKHQIKKNQQLVKIMGLRPWLEQKPAYEVGAPGVWEPPSSFIIENTKVKPQVIESTQLFCRNNANWNKNKKTKGNKIQKIQAKRQWRCRNQSHHWCHNSSPGGPQDPLVLGGVLGTGVSFKSLIG